MSVRNIHGASAKRALLALAVAGAAVALSACTPDEYPTDKPGTTPPVQTGNQVIPGDLVNADDISAGDESTAVGTVSLINPKGDSVGAASFVPAGEGVKVTLRVVDLPKGQHKVGIYSVGDCGGDSSFSGVGSVINGGNLPGISVGDNGTGSAIQDVASLDVAGLNGKSMVIGGTDGNIACGVITAG
ncbi:superoxide dismutase family protein [Gordonia sp. VNK21]|uniref:superoxide dismutase family protein n=1 Tax=Gordonia sp. VNK21 TaxID=3382483 RepID=UPI0038D4D7BA